MGHRQSRRSCGQLGGAAGCSPSSRHAQRHLLHARPDPGCPWRARSGPRVSARVHHPRASFPTCDPMSASPTFAAECSHPAPTARLPAGKPPRRGHTTFLPAWAGGEAWELQKRGSRCQLTPRLSGCRGVSRCVHGLLRPRRCAQLVRCCLPGIFVPRARALHSWAALCHCPSLNARGAVSTGTSGPGGAREDKGRGLK